MTQPEAAVPAESQNTNASLQSPRLKVIDRAGPIVSYIDTEPDGAIQTQADGSLIRNRELRRLFDYFLSAMGELELDEIRTELIAFIDRSGNSHLLPDILDAFDDYQQYLLALESFSLSLDPDLKLADRLELLSKFRRQTLGETLAADYFADEEAYARYRLAKSGRTVDLQPEESEQERWQRVEDLAMGHQTVIDETRDFEQEQMNAAARFSIRSQQYGDAAAIRLAELDQSRSEFNDMVSHYIDQRRHIEKSGNDRMVLKQLHARYTAHELKRLQVYWQAHKNG